MTEFNCKECEKEFNTKEAFEQHNNSKHFKAPKVNLNKKKIKNWGIIIGIITLLVAGGYGLSYREKLPGKYDDFAKCLSEKGIKEYGAYWCSNCLAQKELFGRSFKYVNYVECSLPNNAGQTQICIADGIESYPTWEFANGTRIEGLMTLENIATRSGCTLN